MSRDGAVAVRGGGVRQVGRVAVGGGLLRWVVLAVAVGCWEVAARAHDSVYFPPPGRIADHAYELWFSGPVRQVFLTDAAVDNIGPSLGRMAAGFVIAAVAGIALGVAVGRSRRTYALCNPVLQFARAVPPRPSSPSSSSSSTSVRRCRSRRSPSALSGRC